MAPETPTAAPALAPFTSISAKAYEHPADRAATAVLHRLPFFDPLVKKLLRAHHRAPDDAAAAGQQRPSR